MASLNPATPEILPQRYANLCCAPNRCPNNSLSVGGGGRLGVSGEKRRLPFSRLALITIQLRTSIWVEAASSDTRFQRFTFPGLLKSSDEKGWKGAEGGSQPERLCSADAAEPRLKGPLPHTGSAVLVQTQYVLSHSRSRSASEPQPSSLQQILHSELF